MSGEETVRAGRATNLVKIEIALGKGVAKAYVFVPIESVVAGLIDFAGGDELEYEMKGAFANGNAARLTLECIVPPPKCPKCGTECK